MKRTPAPAPARPESGVTLVELLAALIVSAFVVIVAGRIFLSGNHQFLARRADSERLSTLYRLKGMLRVALQGEVARCASGKLWLKEDAEEQELGTLVKARFPDMVSAEFRCLEVSADAADLVEWKDRFQPRLVEYRVVLEMDGKADSLSGSWIK